MPLPPCYLGRVTSKFHRRSKPAPYSFRLEIDGVVCASFQDATGLDVPHGTPRKTITFRRGATIGAALPAWRSQGGVPPKDGRLVMLDGTGVEKGRWGFQAGRISKWIGPDLKAKHGLGAAITILELTCERIDED